MIKISSIKRYILRIFFFKKKYNNKNYKFTTSIVRNLKKISIVLFLQQFVFTKKSVKKKRRKN
jgi:predicted membrane protein